MQQDCSLRVDLPGKEPRHGGIASLWWRDLDEVYRVATHISAAGGALHQNKLDCGTGSLQDARAEIVQVHLHHTQHAASELVGKKGSLAPLSAKNIETPFAWPVSAIKLA